MSDMQSEYAESFGNAMMNEDFVGMYQLIKAHHEAKDEALKPTG